MEKIIYKTNMVFNINVDYKNKYMKINNSLRSTDFIFIYCRYDNFMKYNPPCKDFLICNMCVREKMNEPAVKVFGPYLYIQICDKLKDFVNDNKLFCLQGVL